MRNAAALAGMLMVTLVPCTRTAEAVNPKPTDGIAAVVPDWNGVWVLDEFPLDKADPAELGVVGENGPMTPQPGPALKGEYAQRAHARMEAIKAGSEGSPGVACLPNGMPDFWAGPYAFEILQTPKQINIFQEFLQQTRRIYLDGRPAPKDLDPSYNGRSTGHWEGNALLVTTTALRADSQIGDGIFMTVAVHSDAMRITERLQSPRPDQLEVNMTVEDPKAFVRPWVRTIRLHRAPHLEIEEYLCQQDNLDAPQAPASNKPKS